MRVKHLLSAAVAGLVFAQLASAHTSYILPNTFDATFVRMVTLESSFTDDFAKSEVGVSSQDWHIIAPDGARRDYDNTVELKQVTMLEASLADEGTYRFTTGERLGRKGKMIRSADGAYKSAFQEGGGEPVLAEGETFVSSQTATIADVYVSKGAPTYTAVNAPGGRLDIRPLVHPNMIFAEKGFSALVTFDGEPLAGQVLELVRSGSAYDDGATTFHVTTNAEGRLDLSFDKPGVYLLMTRHQAAAPVGSETEIRSYTTSLTFDVTN